MGVSVSRNGRIVFGSITAARNIWSAEIAPKAGTAALQPFASDPTGKRGLTVAANGSRVAYVSYGNPTQRAVENPVAGSGNVEIRIRNLASGQEDVILGSGRTPFMDPRLSPDGSQIAYVDAPDGTSTAYVAAVGSSSARALSSKCYVHAFFSHSSDLLLENPTLNRLERQSLNGGNPVPLIDASKVGFLGDVALAPTDRFVAFTAGGTVGKAVLYVAPVGPQSLGPESWTKVAEHDSYLRCPAWSPDGKVLYYFSNRDGFPCVWAQPIANDGKPDGAPVTAFHNHTAHGLFPQLMKLGVNADRLYLLLAEAKGNLWSLKTQ
jgi:Tol biopolymer transport system component